jgi:hypothetical protein
MKDFDEWMKLAEIIQRNISHRARLVKRLWVLKQRPATRYQQAHLTGEILQERQFGDFVMEQWEQWPR